MAGVKPDCQTIKNLNMTSKNNTRPRVRKAEVEDFEQVYPLLQEINNTRLSWGDWHKLFENHWNLAEFSPGMVLATEDEIVGYLGTVFSIQMVDGKEQLFCNLTSWIVREAWRSHSFMMLLPLVRNKDIVLTSFSSNDVTYAVYKKLGFKDGHFGRRIVYSWPSFYSGQYSLISDHSEIEQKISVQNRKIFDDHKSFGNTCLLIQYQDQECLLLGVTRKKRLKIYYASNIDFMCQHFKHFRQKLMAHFKVRRIQVDGYILKDSFLWFSRRVKRGNPYQYKTGLDNLTPPSPQYSEIFLLNM